MHAFFSRPLSGYAALWPPLDLGADLAMALYAIGYRFGDPVIKAHGYAIAVESSGTLLPLQRLAAMALPQARLEAIGRAGRRPVSLLRAVAMGAVTAWQKIEEIGQIDSDEALEISTDGLLVEKAYNPRVKVSVDELVNRMARTVTHELSETVQPLLKKALTDWAGDIDWNRLTQQQFSEAWQAGNAVLNGAVGRGYGLAAPGIEQRINTSIVDLHEVNQRYLKNTHLPRAQISFNQVDERVLDGISRQAGWWVRDSSGQISEALTAQGRSIVQEGIRLGIGRDQIADRLIKQLPGMWEKYGFNYARTVASVAVSRGRSWSEIASYRQVGIASLEVMAMLDERTTDYCRCMDGTIISVGTSYNHQLRAASVQDPEEIKNVAPFFRTKKNSDGTRDLFIGGTKSKFATVTRSGVGRADDRGSFTRHISTKTLNKNGVTVPPYHYQCRTLTLPREEMVQVPDGYEIHSGNVPATDDAQIPVKGKKQQRPLESVKEPKPGRPIIAGQRIPLDRPGRSSNVKPQNDIKRPDVIGPSTLGEYNNNANIEAVGRYGDDAKITNVEFNDKTGNLIYTIRRSDGKSSRIIASVPIDQQKKIREAALGSKKLSTRSGYVIPKPAKHSVAQVKRSGASIVEQTKQADRLKRWNTGANRSKHIKSIVVRLENDSDFAELLKGKKYSGTSDFVYKHMAKWASSTAGSSIEMNLMQLAVSEEFGIGGNSVALLKPDIVARLKKQKKYGKLIAGYRKYVRAVYEETQEFLKTRGISNVSVVRGVRVRSDKRAPKGSLFDGVKRDGTMTTQPLSSYSADSDLAYNHASGGTRCIMTRQLVPRERILGMYATGIGTDYGSEYVVIGGVDDYTEHFTWNHKKKSMRREEALKKLFGDK